LKNLYYFRFEFLARLRRSSREPPFDRASLATLLARKCSRSMSAVEGICGPRGRGSLLMSVIEAEVGFRVRQVS